MAQIGVQLTVPIYQGGFVNSKVREAIALQDNARQNVEFAKRCGALQCADRLHRRQQRRGLDPGVRAGVQVGAGRATKSNRLGQEVGVRTNLDVLNTQQNVFQARHDVAQAYFNYLIGVLRLQSPPWARSPSRIWKTSNRQLRG